MLSAERLVRGLVVVGTHRVRLSARGLAATLKLF
jgi:hypothetical protein